MNVCVCVRVEMPCSDLGACNHNAAAGIRTLEQDTKNRQIRH